MTCRGRRRHEGLSKRAVGLLLLGKPGLPRTRCHPAPMRRPPRLLAFLDHALVRPCAVGLRRRFDGDRGAAERRDFRRGGIGLRLRADASAGSDAAGAASFAGDRACAGGEVSPVAAILVASAMAGMSVRAEAISLCAGVSGSGISDLAASELVIPPASTRQPVRARLVAGRFQAVAGSATAGTLSDIFCSEASGSTRSIASTGLVASLCCANIASRAARHDELLANSS